MYLCNYIMFYFVSLLRNDFGLDVKKIRTKSKRFNII